MKQTNHRLFKGLILLLVLFCLEAIGRLFYNFGYSDHEKVVFEAFEGLAFAPNLVLNYIPHPYLVYTLNPDRKHFRESSSGPEQLGYINSLGFRGKEISREKPAGAYRIVCIGGSTTFGLLEPDEDKTYPAVLEAALNAKYKTNRFQVINAGTPGWTSAESLINFHFRIRALSPDMIILYEGVNDTVAMRWPDEGGSDYSQFRKIVDYSPPSRFNRVLLKWSALYRVLYGRARGFTTDINSLSITPGPDEAQQDINLNAATGKYFKKNMEALLDLALANHITPVVVTIGHGPWHASITRLNDITRELAKTKNVTLVDFEKMSEAPYFSADHIHLTRPGNIALVNAILEALKNEKVLDGKR